MKATPMQPIGLCRLEAGTIRWYRRPARPRSPRLVALMHQGWSDGNGRTPRSLQTLMIAREGVLAPESSSIEAWLGRPGDTWEYHRELGARGAVHLPDQDVHGWVRFTLTAYHQQAQTVRARIDRSGKAWTLLFDFVESASFDDRVISALYEVAMSGPDHPAGPARPARPCCGGSPRVGGPHQGALLQGRRAFAPRRVGEFASATSPPSMVTGSSVAVSPGLIRSEVAERTGVARAGSLR